MKALKILQSSLPDSTFRSTFSVASAKDLWDLLEKGNEEAKLRRVENEFEELSMYEGEPMDVYLERVLDILERSRRLGIAKSDDEVIKKLLGSLSWSYDGAIPVLEEIMNLKDMTLKDLIDMLDLFGDHPETMPNVLKGLYERLKKEQMWCGLCKKHNHNQEDCYYNPMARNVSGGGGGARQCRGGQCHQCGERGHYARDCSTQAQKKNAKPEHFMLGVTAGGGFTFDEDRTYRGRVGLGDGKVIMAEGKGDVRIVTKGVRKIVKNVLFVPRLNRNVLSVGQMTSRGYTVIMGAGECTIKDETGKVFDRATWEERGIGLRLQVIEGNLTS
ncbi:uncharacterized protein LOC130495488 [Raphanus sativus]|uniref:Uncharacterized protein LOC130495488 n=1 Tax=Raphanus sativus TaxID=3726 RepID=A0A9W3BUB7_RAPSA|nr:uncharacterized protein LOC130495488 [Raphanus sativus]